MRHLAPDLEIDSAGTAGWHQGKPPYGPMQEAAQARGYDMSALRARQVTKADFGDFDLILAMDRQNLADLEELQPAKSAAKLQLFSEHGREGDPEDVPDPYYTRDFDGALALIEAYAEGLKRALS